MSSKATTSVGTLVLVGAMFALVMPAHAALHPNAINLNAINLNALARNSLTPSPQTADDAWQLSPRGVTLPSGRSLELPR